MCVFRLRIFTDCASKLKFFYFQSIRQRFDRAYGIMFHGQVWLPWITLFVFLMFNSTPTQEVNLTRYFNRQKSLRLSFEN